MGIGTDLLRIARIRPSCQHADDPFVRRTFTARECAQAAQRSDPVIYYATRFAGKEAVFKSLGAGADALRFAEIEILDLDSGQPLVVLLGNTAAAAAAMGVRQVLVSLSYDTDYVIAFAQAVA